LSAAILLARHGQTADNAAGLILGRRDPPLSAEGEAQSRRLAAELSRSGLAAVWSSPLRRARDTAAVVGAAAGVVPQVLPELVESDRGRWEGRAVAQLAQEDPARHAAFVAGDADFAFPGGESLRAQAERTSAALAAVARGPLPALVVAHAGTIRAALAAAGRSLPPESALGHGQVCATLDAATLG
jgi:broad specificity phosphatase PhoE